MLQDSRFVFEKTIFALALLLFSLPAVADPSFDCGRARTLDEKTICANSYLAQSDYAVADAHKRNDTEFQSKQSIVSRFLQERSECGNVDACIASVQLSALLAYRGRVPWVYNYVLGMVGNRADLVGRGLVQGSSGIPTKHAECSLTRIKVIKTSFGEDVSYENEDNGTAIEYDNGGFVISHSRDPGLFNALFGQPVVVCLMSVPYDCPEGDDRGRFYYTLNLATLSDWVMADAQHMCGGT